MGNADFSDGGIIGRPEDWRREGQERPGSASPELYPTTIYGPTDARWDQLLVRFGWMRPSISQAEIESAFCQCPDELAALVVDHRTVALRTLGNGVHPLQAAVAFIELVRRMKLADPS
jgi:hypothetical protein